jgi:hypothetical protein
MKTLMKALLFGVCMATGCSTVGCCGAVVADDESNAIKIDDCIAEADTAAVQGTATGTFTDTGNNVSANIANATVSASVGAGSGTATTTSIAISAGTAVFSSPTGATSNSFDVTIELTSSLSNGTFTNNTSGATGGVNIGYATASGGDSYSAESGNGATTGTWSLDITSESEICSISTTTAAEGFYKIHGSLNATMPDSNTGTGTLSLTF